MLSPAYILAGGQSRRFGSDKARYAWPAGPQLQVLADQLRCAGHVVHVVADRSDRYRDLGFNCLTDVQPDSGPLAGLARGLIHHRDGWLLLVSCDQRNWQPAWYEALAVHRDDDVDAICYFDTQWQPLPGLYHTRLLETILDRLQQRQLSFHGMLETLGPACRPVQVSDPPSRWSFNTPTELDPQ